MQTFLVAVEKHVYTTEEAEDDWHVLNVFTLPFPPVEGCEVHVGWPPAAFSCTLLQVLWIINPGLFLTKTDDVVVDKGKAEAEAQRWVKEKGWDRAVKGDDLEQARKDITTAAIRKLQSKIIRARPAGFMAPGGEA